MNSRPLGLEQACHHARPAVDARQPAQGTDAGVHEVEGAVAEHVGGLVHVGVDELHGGPGRIRQPAGLGQGRGREVETGHVGAQARERDGVGADVALQVHAAQARHVTEQGQIEPNHITEV